MESLLLKRILALFVTAFLIINFVPHAYAEKEDDRTITVGYPIQQGLTDIDQNGNFTGYTYEYLEEVAQYTGWNYEYIQIDAGEDVNASLETMLDMVARGEIDIIGSCYYMDELTENYNYTSQSYGSASTVLQVLYNDTNPLIIDSQTMQTIKIAVISKVGRSIDELNEFCKTNLIEPVYIYCDSVATQLQALKSGDAQAILNSSFAFTEGVKTIASFANKPIYFMGSKNAKDTIIRDLSEAISTINSTNPYLQTELFEKYFAPKLKEFVPTEEDIKFIAEGKAIKVGYCPTLKPFYGENNDKQPEGIAVDVIKLIAEMTGIKYEFVSFPTIGQVFDASSKGEIDIVPVVPYDYRIAREQNISLSRSFFSTQYAMIVDGDDVADMTTVGKNQAVIAPYKSLQFFEKSGATPIVYESVDDCIRAVKDGKADFTYVDTYTANYFSDKFKGDVRSVPLAGVPYNFSFGVSKQADRRIVNLINKAVAVIDNEKVQEIIRLNTIPKSEYTISKIVENNPTLSIIIIASVFVLIIIFLGYVILVHRKTNKSISFEMKKHDRIYQLLNDYFFEYDYKKDELIISVPHENEGEKPKMIKKDYKDPAEKEKDKRFLDIIRTNRYGIVEVQVDFYDGSVHWVRLALQTICDNYDKPLHTIGKINIIDNEIAEREELLEKVERDGLTHAFNAESCRKKISKAIVKLPLGKVATLFFVDIDFFKEVNDTYGHMCGDELLIRLAELLGKHFSQEDIVGRLGGDEFMMYSENIDTKEKLEAICQSICENVRKLAYKEIKNVTLSVGASFVSADDSFDDCYKRVDDALYKAKGNGRNCYKIAES